MAPGETSEAIPRGGPSVTTPPTMPTTTAHSRPHHAADRVRGPDLLSRGDVADLEKSLGLTEAVRRLDSAQTGRALRRPGTDGGASR